MAVSSYGVPGSSITSITCCCHRSLPPPPPSSTTDLRRRAVLFTIASTLSSFHHHQHLPLPPTTSLPPLPAFANEEEKEDELQKEEDIAVSVFEKASPSVVAVQNVEILEQKSMPNSRIGDENTTVNGTGSGFVWDKWGHIVTNYHVVAKLATDTSGLQHCKIVLMDSATSATLVKEADLVGCDAAHDLAVLKISVEGLTLKPASLGTSHDLRVGQSCFAIGNPYGYERTLTTGVVSGLGRQIPSPSGNSIKGAIQTDAAINSGNSGGPLIDSYGHVVGVNTATFTRKGTGTSSGVNFAIPIDTVSKIVPYLIVYGTDLKDRY